MDLSGNPLPADSPESWTIAPAETIAWREWDGELVVYLDELGSTHLLNPYAGAVFLTLLHSGPQLSLDDLIERLDEDDSVHAGIPPQARDRAPVRQVMAEFERIGLVQRH